MNNQQELCKKYGAEYLECDLALVSGVADNVDGRLMPINGLRHRLEGGTTGCYIWAGEEMGTDDDFFKSIHTRHLVDRCPYIEQYLGLAPGWRFLIDPSKDFVDVWYDPELLV